MQISPLVLFLSFALISYTSASECSGHPDPGAKSNLNPIYTNKPVFVRQVQNAKLYKVAAETNDSINVVHLWGTPYEMGYAHGALMKEEVKMLLSTIWEYFVEQVEQALNGTFHHVKPWFIDLVAEIGLPAALQLSEELNRPYTPQYFYDEMQGLADSTGISVQRVIDIHQIGELTQGQCSMYGAWGPATVGGGVMQLRALDWDIDAGFQNAPQVTVYHINNASNGHTFANVGWSGWIGSITGMSKHHAISEIGVAFPDSSFGNMSRFGVPFTFLLRDILQWDNTLDDSINRIVNSHRTCDLILGISDSQQADGFRGVEYSHSVAKFFDDKNMEPVADWHPKIPNVVYYGMDWLCPGYTTVLARQLTRYWGNITAENTIRDITAIVQTGDLHIAVYDLSHNLMFVANARRNNTSGPEKAYDRMFIKFNMTELFAEPQTGGGRRGMLVGA